MIPINIAGFFQVSRLRKHNQPFPLLKPKLKIFINLFRGNKQQRSCFTKIFVFEAAKSRLLVYIYSMRLLSSETVKLVLQILFFFTFENFNTIFCYLF